jgi:hypothetical protein
VYDRVHQLLFSPDGKRVAYHANALQALAVRNGELIQLEVPLQ